MSDRWVVALAAATATGAVAGRGPSPLVGLLLSAVALASRRPWLLCLGAAVLAGGLAERSWAGLDGVRPAPFHGLVTLVSDPRPDGGAVVADVRAAGRRFEARATGATARRLAPRLAGERVVVRGRVGPGPPGRVAAWAARHVSGRLRVDALGPGAPPSGVARAANGVRRLLARGASGLDPTTRSLFVGFVVGDDRGQPPLVADDFRAAGLVHLLAVSGQNVAFVLALAAPGLRRLPMGWRLAGTVAVVGSFGVLTRFEPSVSRAAAMASTRAVAEFAGRPAAALRLLGLAVTALLVVDPLLVHSVGFRLSVAASLGIVALAPGLERRLPGPRWLAESVAVTIAAHAGVAPVLIPVFGGIPVAALPANVLAVPAAGPIMAWGMTAGVLAGVVGGAGAALLHLPTAIGIGWVATIARVLGRLPLGELGAAHLPVVVCGLLMAVRAAPRSALRRVGAAVVAAALLAPAWTLHRVPPSGPLVPGAALVRAGPAVVVVVDGRARPAALVQAMRRRGVRRVDVVLVRTAAPAASAAAALVAARWPTGVVLGPGDGPDRRRLCARLDIACR